MMRNYDKWVYPRIHPLGGMSVDKKAKKILFDTYWSGAGWKRVIHTEPEDFEYAKSKGLMFEPLTISHNDCIKKIIKITSIITPEQAPGNYMSAILSARQMRIAKAKLFLLSQIS